MELKFLGPPGMAEQRQVDHLAPPALARRFFKFLIEDKVTMGNGEHETCEKGDGDERDAGEQHDDDDGVAKSTR